MTAATGVARTDEVRAPQENDACASQAKIEEELLTLFRKVDAVEQGGILDRLHDAIDSESIPSDDADEKPQDLSRRGKAMRAINTLLGKVSDEYLFSLRDSMSKQQDSPEPNWSEPNWMAMADKVLGEPEKSLQARLCNIYMSGWEADSGSIDPDYLLETLYLNPKQAEQVVHGIAEAFKPFVSHRATQ